MTIGSLIQNSTLELKKSGSPTADLDVRTILEEVLKKDQSYFYTHPESPITNSAYQKFRRLIRRRKKGEPVAYLLGWKEFYGLKFKVNKNVLIPRPETELLVEQAIKFVKPIKSKVKSPINVVDVGTGSGAIIIALAKTLKYDNIRYYASDISKKALKVARENARLNGIDGNIKFFQSDLLANFKLPKKIDILIANLPYVPFSFCHSEASFCHSEAEPKNLKILRSVQDDIEKSIRNSKTLSFEPQNALFAAKGGLELIEKLIIQISKLSYKPQLIILEVFETHPHLIKQIAKKYLPMYSLEAKKDYAGLNRLVILSVLP